MGLTTHFRPYKQFQISIFSLRIEWSFICKHWIPFTQRCFVPSLVEIDLVVLQKSFNLTLGSSLQDWLKLVKWLLKFCPCNIFPWKRIQTFIWTNFNPVYPRMLCAKLSRNWCGGSGEEDFLISPKYFRVFVIISSGKGHSTSFE